MMYVGLVIVYVHILEYILTYSCILCFGSFRFDIPLLSAHTVHRPPHAMGEWVNWFPFSQPLGRDDVFCHRLTY